MVGRSRLGGMPSAFRMLAIVDRADTMTKILQRFLDARVPPAQIVRRHADNQASDLNHHCRSARPLPRVGRFLRNQIAMPSENGVWCEHGNRSQHVASESPPQHGEPAALIIVQTEPLGRPAAP